MTQEEFVWRGRPRWQELERLLAAARGRGVAGLGLQEVRRLAELYRLAAADLAHARTFFPAAEVTGYLNQLVAEAHGLVYAPSPRRLREVLAFFRRGIPAAVRRHWRAVALAGALLALGGGLGVVAALALPELVWYLLPEPFQVGVPSPPAEDPVPLAFRPLVSTWILTHNVRIGIMSFGLGLTAGVGTVFILVHNGAMVGALAVLVHQAGWALPFWSLILPHGVLELMAIAVMGGAGLVIAGAIIEPGRRTRRRAVAEAAREALPLVVAGAAMLAVAATIEGFFTPILALNPWLKIGVGFAAGGAAAGWLASGFAGRSGEPLAGAEGPGGGPAPGPVRFRPGSGP
ncbi:MAG: stage II sporulation protein M [Bacillota bacterium]|nr:MAG: hypothetical protein DIU70_08025 [Bacillota bacterium]